MKGAKGPVPTGPWPLWTLSREAEPEQVTAIRHASSSMTPAACRSRLSSSRRGFLACTRGALPTVLPVELQLRDGELLVCLRERTLLELVGGQVVALSVGRRAVRFRRGWTVTALGRLALANNNRSLRADGLPLEIAQVEGVTFQR